MKEIWKDIEGYEGIYQVSSNGNVKSLSRMILFTSKLNKKYERPYGEKTLSPKVDKDGYLLVNLYLNKSPKTHKVHRLVATHFIDNLESKPQVNHIDGMKTNNEVQNLEWVTPKENLAHASLEGLLRVGSSHGNSKLTEKQIIEIFNLSKSGLSQSKIGEMFNVNQNAIWKILNRKTWSHVKIEDNYAV